LPYPDDTLAILLVSIPDMFENLLLPFIMDRRHGDDPRVDPLDQCLKAEFLDLQRSFSNHKTEFIQDHELHPNRRPKILLQTAGHVSGAAYYYQRSDVRPNDQPWDAGTNIYGVSVHPRYGGWFAFRGVLIFQDLTIDDSELKPIEPVNCVSSQEKVIELLEKFNKNWEDWSYRDVLDGPVLGRYSLRQREYFGTVPAKRSDVIDKWIKDK
jgi:methylmalonic aciduria homocystinuria type C protein